MVAQDRGRLEEAEDWYRKSLAISEDLGDRPGMADSYHQLGMVAQDRGRLDEAEDWYRKSLAINEDLGDRPAWPQLPPARHGRPGAGAAGGGRGLVPQVPGHREELGDRPRMASSYHQLGMVAQDRGRLDEAEDWYRKSLAISEDLGDRPGMATSYRQLGWSPRTGGGWMRPRTGTPRPGHREDLGTGPGWRRGNSQLGLLAEDGGPRAGPGVDGPVRGAVRGVPHP